jgi:Flp pilus assembly protein protease CpaA
MDPYWFLFVLGGVWLLFAVIQDLRTREIANWLTFSLIVFGLGYRALFSLSSGSSSFFVQGLVGTILFMCFAYLLYYGRAFAGGDAKLLVGFGALLPFEQLNDYVILGGGFLMALFLLGALYSLVYSFFIMMRSKADFSQAFLLRVKTYRWFFFLGMGVSCAVFFFLYSISGWFALVPSGILLLLPFLYTYLRTLEQTCMIRKILPANLKEGDWLLRDVSVGKRVIKKTVHGLSLDEIRLLRKSRRSVYIKEGIPFSPAFLLAYLAMLFYVLR